MLKQMLNMVFPLDFFQPKFAGIVGAVAAVGGAAMSANASSKANKAAQQGLRESNETQRYMFDTSRVDQLKQYEQQRADQAPWMNRGNDAGNRLQHLLGLSPSGYSLNESKDNKFAPENMLTRQQLREELLQKYTTHGNGDAASAGEWVLARPAGADVTAVWRNTRTRELREGAHPTGGDKKLSDYASMQDAINAGWTDNPAIVDYNGLNKEIEDKLAKQTADKDAYDAMMRTQGIEAANAAKSDPDYGSLMRSFGQKDLDNDLVYQNGLQFGLDEGAKGLNRLAAARGGFQSGATLKALTRFGNDYATTKTGGAYDRFNNNKQQTYNMLAGVSGTGQVATNQVGSAGQNMVNQNSAYGYKTGVGMGENSLMSGISRGSSYIEKNNALQGAIGSVYGVGKKAGWWEPTPFSPNANGVGGDKYSGYNALANGGWGIE